jgi:hypothetical protein
MQPAASERGQAAAELVAIVPVAIVVALLIGQLLVAGWALVSAGEAARAGARAEHVGADPAAAARTALPDALGAAEVSSRDGRVEVRVRAPALLPGVPPIPLSAATALDPGAR